MGRMATVAKSPVASYVFTDATDRGVLVASPGKLGSGATKNVVIPAKGVIHLLVTALYESAGTSAAYCGIWIGATYYWAKYHIAGVATVADYPMVAVALADNRENFGDIGGRNGVSGSQNPTAVSLDIERLGIPTGAQDVGIGLQAVSANGTLKGLTATTRVIMTIVEGE